MLFCDTMFNEIAAFLSAFWMIFVFSFLVALTGAIAPGPLLTYTIVKSVKASHRGYLQGLWIVAGHALIEIGIIIFLLLGFSFVLKNVIVVRSIGVIGSLILCYFGFTIIRDVRQGKIQTDFLDRSYEKRAPKQGGPADLSQETLSAHRFEPNRISRNIMENPILGGMILSMSNPYWWIWWATIGFAFMIQFDISLNQWPKLLAFFIGHEAGDLAWLLFVSSLSSFGGQYLNRKTYHGILIFCGVFMIVFGVYLGVTPFV